MTASLFAALLLASAPPPAADPVVAAVTSMNVRPLSETGGRPANNTMREFCQTLGAEPCVWALTSAERPAQAREELATAVARQCTERGGASDAAEDLRALVGFIGFYKPEGGVMGVEMDDHTCRTAQGMSGVRAITYDFGKVAGPVGAPPRRGLAAMVNPNRSAYDALTGIFVFSAETLNSRRADQANKGLEACEIERDRAIVQGADTNRGLIVERRGTVALVQPAAGEAIWMKTAELQPASRPRCTGEGSSE